MTAAHTRRIKLHQEIALCRNFFRADSSADCIHHRIGHFVSAHSWLSMMLGRSFCKKKSFFKEAWKDIWRSMIRRVCVHGSSSLCLTILSAASEQQADIYFLDHLIRGRTISLLSNRLHNFRVIALHTHRFFPPDGILVADTQQEIYRISPP